MRILNEIIGPFERRAGLAERYQILLFDLIQVFGLKDKQPDGSAGSKFVEAIGVERSLNRSLLECFNMAIDGSF